MENLLGFLGKLVKRAGKSVGRLGPTVVPIAATVVGVAAVVAISRVVKRGSGEAEEPDAS